MPFLPLLAALLSVAPADTVPSSMFTEFRFRSLGPNRGGRVTAVAGVPDQPLTFYMGATGGGVWKTVNAGEIVGERLGRLLRHALHRRHPRVPSRIPTSSTSAPAPTASAATSSSARACTSRTDAGKTWTHAGLPKAGQIGAVHHPPPESRRRAGGRDRQPLRAQPGARASTRPPMAARSWKQVLLRLRQYRCGRSRVRPRRPARRSTPPCGAASGSPGPSSRGAREGGIYKSTDGGDSWTKLAGGLPDGLFGKARSGGSPPTPNRVYALIEALPGEGLYRSDDRGATWTPADSPGAAARPALLLHQRGRRARPTPTSLYVMATGFWKSVDGGKTFAPARAPHGDHHDLWINPKQPEISVESNDGGANVTLDGMRTWSTQYNQPTAEIYQVNLDDQTPYWLYGGQQDNGTAIAVPSLPPAAWTSAIAGRRGGNRWAAAKPGPRCPSGAIPTSSSPTARGASPGSTSVPARNRTTPSVRRDLYGHDPQGAARPLPAGGAGGHLTARSEHRVPRVAVSLPHPRRGEELGADFARPDRQRARQAGDFRRARSPGT